MELPKGSAVVSGSKSPIRPSTPDSNKHRVDMLSHHFRCILALVGEDVDREGLLATPERAAKALMSFTQGYEESVSSVVKNSIFNEFHDEMVVVKRIDIHSLCEHHLVPFHGHVCIGYLPNQRVIGLSKLVRIVEVYASRLQVQERLTRQIAKAVETAVDPRGVGVVIEASHMCMVMRGVKKVNSCTVTSSMTGVFREDYKTRCEFLELIKLK